MTIFGGFILLFEFVTQTFERTDSKGFDSKEGHEGGEESQTMFLGKVIGNGSSSHPEYIIALNSESWL